MLSKFILILNIFFVLIFTKCVLSAAIPEETTVGKKHEKPKNSICDVGLYQSPINILPSTCRTKQYVPVKFMDDLLFSNEVVVENNAETAKITLLDKKIKPKVSGGPMGNNIYIIDNIHFHWGTKLIEGCEHTIDNKHFAMESHIVAYKDTFKTLDEAVANRGVAVLSFLYEARKENNIELKSLVHAVTEILQPHTTNNEKGEILCFFKDYIAGGFFTYEGSLTTGTCAEGVLWTLYKKPIPIAKNQVLIFEDIINDDGDELQNWRKTFPLNNREVDQSQF